MNPKVFLTGAYHLTVLALLAFCAVALHQIANDLPAKIPRDSHGIPIVRIDGEVAARITYPIDVNVINTPLVSVGNRPIPVQVANRVIPVTVTDPYLSVQVAGDLSLGPLDVQVVNGIGDEIPVSIEKKESP